MIVLGILLILAFLFFIGSVLGWLLELVFRRFFSSENKEHKWINPGFCTGPYLPIYGFGLCVLFLIALLEQYSVFENPILNKCFLFLIMSACMTLIEYIAGIMLLKMNNLRLWDYRNEWGNIQGVICPKFSFFWAVLGAFYYFLVHPRIIGALIWLSENLAFSFVIGLFFGVFAVDLCLSTQLISKLKKYAKENEIIIKCENLKSSIRARHNETKEKYHFFRPFRSDKPLAEHLKELKETFETKKNKTNKIK